MDPGGNFHELHLHSRDSNRGLNPRDEMANDRYRHFWRFWGERGALRQRNASASFRTTPCGVTVFLAVPDRGSHAQGLIAHPLQGVPLREPGSRGRTCLHIIQKRVLRRRPAVHPLDVFLAPNLLSPQPRKGLGARASGTAGSCPPRDAWPLQLRRYLRRCEIYDACLVATALSLYAAVCNAVSLSASLALRILF